MCRPTGRPISTSSRFPLARHDRHTYRNIRPNLMANRLLAHLSRVLQKKNTKKQANIERKVCAHCERVGLRIMGAAILKMRTARADVVKANQP